MGKICTKCGEPKPETLEFFYPRGKNSKKLMSWCKDCVKKKNKRRYKGWKKRKEQEKAVIQEVEISMINNPNRCGTCERKRGDGTCHALLVMIGQTEDCWAWTDDKSWYEKLTKASKMYAESIN